MSETLERALELAPDERRSFVHAQVDDEELRREIESLLDSHESEPGFLETSPLDSLELAAGDVLGPYQIEGAIAEGGMGAVYRASRADRSYERTVALKVIKPGMDTRAVLRRFEAERRILARLEHAAIARLYDAGATDLGRPWLALEFVDGEPITSHADRLQLGTRDRLQLFLQVCHAVEHAHRNLIVHRDLKPSNVMVRREDGTVALLDFGVAKLLEDDEEGLTRTGEQLMTRPYAAPEQVRGESVTTATDVHALGILLFELLTGQRPFHGETARQLEQEILQSAPALPRQVEAELGAICGKALRKDPLERYGSAAALAADVERWLQGLPVEARPASALYVARKFAKRNLRVVLFAAASLLALIALGALYTWQVTAERNSARLEAEKARQVADFMGGLFRDADPAETGGTEVSAREVLDRAADRLEAEDQTRPEIRAQLFQSLGQVYTSLALYSDAERLLTRAANIRSAALGDDHPDRADDLLARSALALARGRLQEAAEAAKRGLELRRRHLGPHDPRTALAMRTAAAADHALGRYPRAELQLREALEVLVAGRGEDDSDVATVRSSLATTLQQLDRTDEAEALFRSSLATRQEVFGPRHSAVSASMAELAQLHTRVANYEEAEDLLKDALQLDRELHGESHPNVAAAVFRLGRLEMLRGNYTVADQLIQESLGLARAAYGDDSLRVAEHLSLWAANELSREDYERALEILDEALAISEAAVGDAHPVSVQLLGDRALAISYLGDLQGAEEAYQRVLAAEISLVGERHTSVATTWASLSTLLFDLDRQTEAIEAARRALEIRRALLPEVHPALANSLYSFGTILLYTERFAEAEQPIAESASIRDAIYGQSDWRTIQADGRLANIRSLLTRTEARNDLEEALERARVHLPENFTWVREQIEDALADHDRRLSSASPSSASSPGSGSEARVSEETRTRTKTEGADPDDE